MSWLYTVRNIGLVLCYNHIVIASFYRIAKHLVRHLFVLDKTSLNRGAVLAIRHSVNSFRIFAFQLASERLCLCTRG